MTPIFIFWNKQKKNYGAEGTIAEGGVTGKPTGKRTWPITIKKRRYQEWRNHRVLKRMKQVPFERFGNIVNIHIWFIQRENILKGNILKIIIGVHIWVIGIYFKITLSNWITRKWHYFTNASFRVTCWQDSHRDLQERCWTIVNYAALIAPFGGGCGIVLRYLEHL